ncbi:MAG: GTP-binding protein [Thaumarchaeota archaeon]|nr:GTP-binding protein [Nitrososphaerota archaeon]
MFNVVIVGHVDHGKSTLIGRLLYDSGSVPEEKLKEIREVSDSLGREVEFSYLVDALEEERKGEMTIETTRTFFKSRKRDYSIIDAPGHLEFLKNMITGASQADASILIVDVAKGVEEQTKRHAYLLRLLGMEKVVVAINKMDLVGNDQRRFEEVKDDISSYLRTVGLNPLFVIPISAYLGDNVIGRSESMRWYKGPTLVEALDSMPERAGYPYFRMPVQDVYLVRGERVYVGNVISGRVRKGDEVHVTGSGKSARVEKIIVLDGELEEARAPKGIGISLDPDPMIGRGSILWNGKGLKGVKTIESTVFCTEELKSGEELEFSCSVQEAGCKVEVFERIDPISLKRRESEVLGANEIGRIGIRLDKEVFVESFKELPELGRFVLRRKGMIVGGGIIR